jgi:hypothetical protein
MWRKAEEPVLVVLVGSQEANRKAVRGVEVARAGATMGAPGEALRAASRYYPQKSADPSILEKYEEILDSICKYEEEYLCSTTNSIRSEIEKELTAENMMVTELFNVI